MSNKQKIKTVAQVLLLTFATFYGFFSAYANLWLKLGLPYGLESVTVPFVLAVVSVVALFASIWRN